MRGVISLAAAFALPLALPNGEPFPGREYILFLTFCVIFVTLVLQGLSLPVVIRWLAMSRDTRTDDEERQARVAANTAAREFLDRAIAEQDAPEEIAGRLRAEYDERLEQLEECAANRDDPGGGVVTGDYQRLQHRALSVERNTIIELRNQHVINDEALRRIQRDLDLAEARLTGA
jgi:CPA1 family monovalent cation:H+ antiporter